MASTTKLAYTEGFVGPSLKSFIRKCKAISLYRRLFRTSVLFHGDEKKKIQEEIRKGFNMNRNEADPTAIAYLLAKGEEQLQFLESGSSSLFPKTGEDDNIFINDDSWVGKGPKDDKFGRVGTGWPWMKNIEK